MPEPTALVMRATGAQGRGTIKHLLRKGWHIHAMVSDKSSDRAKALGILSSNIRLYEGDWKDPKAIEAAMQGCKTLFLNQMPSFTDDAEVQEARTVLNIAKDLGVSHVVFASTLPLNNPDIREELKGSPVAAAVLNKGDVEEVVKSSGVSWTILRPAVFMTNFLPPLIHYLRPEFKDRKFVNSYGPDCVLPLVDPDDIGAFVAAAMTDSEKFASQTVTVSGENMRVYKILQRLQVAYGFPIEPVYRSLEETHANRTNPYIAGDLLCLRLDKLVEIEHVRNWGIPATSFDAFLDKHSADLKGGTA